MKVKHLKKGEIRVIGIDREAIYELLRETMMEHGMEYFELLSNTVEFDMRWSSKSDIFTCAVFDRNYSPKFLDHDILEKKIGITTKTLFQKNRYKTVCLKDIENENEKK